MTTLTPGPDIQYFASSGTWHRPPGAVRADCLIRASDAGSAIRADGTVVPGERGELLAKSFYGAEIPETVKIEIGYGGRSAPGCADGADGYALIVTHLEQP